MIKLDQNKDQPLFFTIYVNDQPRPSLLYFRKTGLLSPLGFGWIPTIRSTLRKRNLTCTGNCSCPTVMYTVQYHTINFRIIHYLVIQYGGIQYITLQFSALPYSTVQYSALQDSASQYNKQQRTKQCLTVQCRTFQNRAEHVMQCCKILNVQCSTVQFCNVQ